MYQVKQLRDNRVVVHPWPFEAHSFEVNVEAALVSGLQFESDEQLLEAIKGAEVKIKTWILAKE